MFSRKEKLLLFLLASINFTHIVDFMILMPLGPQLMRIFKIDPHQFGLLVSSYTFAAAGSGILASLFLDRFDRKTSLIFCYTGFAIGTLLCAFAPNYAALLGLRFVTGAFGGILSAQVISIVSDSISMERRGTAMGYLMSAFAAASVAGVPFSLYLATRFDWHAPFLFLGGAAFLITLAVCFGLPAMRDHLKGPHHEGSDLFYAIKHVLKSPTQLLALTFMFALVFGHFSIIPFYSPSMVLNGGLLETDLPLIYLTGGIVSLFASPLFGRLTDRFGKKTVFYFGAFASILPIVWATHLGPSPIWVILLVTSSFFFVMSGRMVPAMTMISGVASPRFRGSFMALNSSTQHLAMSSSSYIAGVIVTTDSQGHLLNYGSVGWMAVSFTFLAIFLVTKVKHAEN